METSFTGVLVRRDYKPGQDYVQLIFKGAHETKLSVSRNVRLMKSLTIGGKYKLVGREYKYGSKTIIRDPKATAISMPKAKSRNKKLILIAAIVSVIFTLTGGIAYAAMKQEPAAPSSPAVIQETVEESDDLTVEANTSTDTLPATTDAPANASAAAKPKTTTKPKTTGATTAPSVTSPVTNSTTPSATDTGSTSGSGQEDVPPPVDDTPPPVDDTPPPAEEPITP